MVRRVRRNGQTRWVIDFSFKDPSGQRRRYRRDAEVQTREAAHAEERRRLAALAQKGSPFEVIDPAVRATVAPKLEQGPTLGSITAPFLETYGHSRLRVSTLEHYALIIERFILPTLGALPLRAIDAARVREWDAKLVSEGVTRASRKKAHIVLRSIVRRYAVERGLLQEPPRFPPMPMTSNKLPSMPTPEQLNAILALIQKPTHRLAILLAFHAGLRRGEIRGLLVRDIDLAAGTLRVRRSRYRDVFDIPKGCDEREIPLTPELHAALAGAIAGRAPGCFVALNDRGKPWGMNGLWMMVKSYAARLDIAITFHQLRHTFVSTALAAGAGVHVVQAMVGHKDISTTQRYTHVIDGDKRAAIRSFAERVSRAPSPDT